MVQLPLDSIFHLLSGFCVIPSAAEGPRIFLEASRRTQPRINRLIERGTHRGFRTFLVRGDLGSSSIANWRGRRFTLRFFFGDWGRRTYLARYFHGRGGRRAQPPVGEGSAITSQTQTCSLFVSPYSCVIPSEAEGPRIFLNASRRTPNHRSTTTRLNPAPKYNGSSDVQRASSPRPDSSKARVCAFKTGPGSPQ